MVRNRNKNLIYIAEGFNEDCGALIDIITDKYNKVDWQKFCHHWKEMEFDKLFFGRQSGPELVELTEECLQIARLYIVTQTDNFELQVAGVFIAYALIVIQPYKDLCALRLIPADAYPLQKIEAIARRDNRKDLLMALGKLYVYGHTQFHVSLRERSVDKAIRKYFESGLNVPKCISRRWHGNMGRSVLSALDKVTQKESEYARLKMIAKATAEERIPGIKVQVDMFQPQQPGMADTLRKLTERHKEEDKQEEDSSMSAIKKKAMKQVVDPMKHLQCVSERNKKNETVVPTSLSPSKAKARNWRDILMSAELEDLPLPNPEGDQCFSLPALDAEIGPTTDREKSPEPAFRGFTAKEIESIQSAIEPATDGNKSDLTSPQTKSPRAKRKAGRGKRKGATKRKRTLKNKNNKKLKVINDFYSGSDSSYDYSSDESFKESKNVTDDLAVIRTYKAKMPSLQIQTKHVNTNIVDESESEASQRTYIKAKITQKDIETHKGTAPTLETDMTTHKGKDLTSKTDIKTHKVKETTIQTDIKTHEGKETTIHTKAGVEQLIEFDISDIVITSVKGSQLDNDIEIEFIDKYNNENARCEDVCDVSDGDNNNDEVEVVIEPIEVGNNDDPMEVFELIDSDVKEREALVHSDEGSDETIKKEMVKIINKDKMNREKVDQRRKLKQPNLRSKLKKMGILPVASFD